MQDLGIKIVLATGRMFMGADPVRENLGFDTPVICYQGAMVRKGDDILYQNAVNNDLAREIIEISREKKFHLNLYNDDTLIVEDDNKKIYKEYKQNVDASWSEHSYWGGTMTENGCGITAIATILSGYNKNYTPESLRKKYYPVLDNNTISEELSSMKLQ